MPTPLVEVWEGITMVPVIGTLDADRAAQITDTILARIASVRTDMVIISVGGITHIDADVANYIIRTVRAIHLMGSQGIITGIRPDVAMALIQIGVDLSNIVTFGTMHEGLEYAFARLGWRVTRAAGRRSR